MLRSHSVLTGCIKRRLAARHAAVTPESTETIKSIAALLKHWFLCYLRIKDALVFVESGECRHPLDSLWSERAPFKSNLTNCGKRGDGYTKLFKAEAYSGQG
ncbi:hypothetical protein TrRE_jg2489, partial [Triparma retinervis]